jgi:hypothetical protein
MDEATYGEISAELAVRELRVTVDQPGFRVNELVLVTPLLDAGAYGKQEVARLFLGVKRVRLCWQWHKGIPRARRT